MAQQKIAWAHAKAAGLPDEYDTFSEVASGRTLERPQFAKMMVSVENGVYDVLLVSSLDRLARSGVAELLQLVEKLAGIGVRFVSVRESIDLDPEKPESNAMGMAILTLAATFAKMERDLLSERTRAGIETARSRGKQIGRPRVGPTDDAIARLKSQGLSQAQIARSLGISAATVSRRVRAFKKGREKGSAKSA